MKVRVYLMAEQEAKLKAGEGGNADPTPLELFAAVDKSDAAALRAFAKAHDVPVSPNKNTKPEKLVAAISAKLGA